MGVNLVGDLYDYLARYIVLDERSLLAIAAWVAAAHLADVWDRFPHLGVTSPIRRCGKTRLLELLLQVCPRAKMQLNSSAATVYRSIQQSHPTLLLDEAQFLTRKGSESSESLHDIFCGSISKNATVPRCVGASHKVVDFPIYCPKAVFLIGKLGGTLADRCLPVRLQRKTAGDEVKKSRMREIEEEGQALRGRLEEWAADEGVKGDVVLKYDDLQPFDIPNDRMADLLLPLQAVLEVACPDALPVLREYAERLEELDGQIEKDDPSLRLLAALRDIFDSRTENFLPTETVISTLLGERAEEGWDECNKGKPITPAKLAHMLSEYGIKPQQQVKTVAGRVGSTRGYVRGDFHDAWERYLAPPTPPPDPVNPVKPVKPVNGKKE